MDKTMDLMSSPHCNMYTAILVHILCRSLPGFDSELMSQLAELM